MGPFCGPTFFWGTCLMRASLVQAVGLALVAVLLLSATPALGQGNPSINRARTAPMTFSVYWPCSGNSYGCAPRVLARGVITKDTPAAFSAFWKMRDRHGHPLPPQPTMVFDSPGGSLAAAMELGRRLRAVRLDTAMAASYDRVPGAALGEQETFVTNAICASACVFAFAGGVTRTSEEDGVLGVHQFYGADRDIGEAAAQVTVVVLADYLQAMGVDRSLLDLASLVPAKTMRFLTTSEASSVNLDNASPRQTPWSLAAGQDGSLAATAEHLVPFHGMTTKLALFRDNGVVRLAIGVRFAPTAFGKPEAALEALNGAKLTLTPAKGRTATFDKSTWTLKGGIVMTTVRLDQLTIDALRKAPTLALSSDPGHGSVHLMPVAEFKLDSLHPLMPALLRH